MKNILILTDFSENAFVAAKYFSLIAPSLPIENIFFFHAYQSISTANSEPIVVVDDEVKNEISDELKVWKEKLSTLFNPQIKSHAFLADTDLAYGVNQLCEEHKIDLVVLGISGKSALSKVLIGSNATRLMDSIKFPMLVVSPNVKMVAPKNVLLTTDLKEVNSCMSSPVLDEFVSHVGERLLVLNIAHKESSAAELSNQIRDLHEKLDPHHAEYFFEYSNNTVEGIHKFVKDHEADVVISFHKLKGLFGVLFGSSVSKKLVWDNSASLLVFPVEK